MTDNLDPIFKALADATRRRILDFLKDGPRSTTEIVEQFPELSRFGVMKHLDVLRDAALVNTREEGRYRMNSINAVPLRQIYLRWVSQYEDLWANQLMGLKESLEQSPSSNPNPPSLSFPSEEMRMTMADALLAEFEQEALTTRKFLERLPESKLGWKPHEKSMTAGQLAFHIAESPARVVDMAAKDFIPMPSMGNPQPESVAQVLEKLEETIEKVRSTLPTFSDARMQESWSVRHEGRDILSMPRSAFLRSILLNHWYHHRGQFGVYLRLMGCQVPSSYGPSGDEPPDFLKDTRMPV